MNKKTQNSSILSILLFIIIISLVNSTQNMISPNLGDISNYFGFGGATSQLGGLTFVFMIISGIALAIFGYFADKITRKWLVVIGSLIYSISSIFTILIPSGINGFYAFLFFTALDGIGFGIIIPSIFSLIGDLIKQDERSKGFSFFSIASLLGMAIGLGLSTALGDVDWRLSFFIVGIAGFIAAFVSLFFREPSRIGKDFSFLAEKEAIDYTYRIKASDFRVIFKKKSNVWLIINFVDTIPTGIILFLLYEYMEEYHNVSDETTLIFLIFILLSTLIGTVIFGYIGDKQFQGGNKKARVRLALYGAVVPIPFVFIALIIPFSAPNNASIGDLFSIPGAILMILLLVIGIFINGAVNGSWYATLVDINLPEHRGTVLATANFFDIVGRAIGPLVGSLMADSFGYLSGMMISIVFWMAIPFFWIPILKNVVPEMETTERIFKERIEKLS